MDIEDSRLVKLQQLEVKLAVVAEKMSEMAVNLSELKDDVKSLLGFRSFIWGGAAAVSAIVSLGIELVRRFVPGAGAH